MKPLTPYEQLESPAKYAVLVNALRAGVISQDQAQESFKDDVLPGYGKFAYQDANGLHKSAFLLQARLDGLLSDQETRYHFNKDIFGREYDVLTTDSPANTILFTEDTNPEDLDG